MSTSSAQERRRLGSWLRPRFRRVDVAVAALLAVLGFAAAVQARATTGEGVLASARQEDLVQILDDLTNRETRLRAEIAALSTTRERLSSGTGQRAAAIEEARRRALVLGVLAGTAPASGPGVIVVMTDPRHALRAEAILDALEELRDAGAEAVQLDGSDQRTGDTVRVVASTSFLDAEGGVTVDGVLLAAPYRFTVIGDPATLASALAIPGGVVDTVEQAGGRVTVTRSAAVRVTALRALRTPRYARPADEDAGS